MRQFVVHLTFSDDWNATDEGIRTAIRERLADLRPIAITISGEDDSSENEVQP